MGTPSAGDRIDIFTDGACSGNPGPGGYGALLREGGREREVCGYGPDTTNNRMEVLAAVRALLTLPVPSHVRVVTDSKYLMDGITRWIHGWKRNGWKTAARKPVKNRDLWQALDAAVSPHNVTWEWVEGHSGHPENERADELARRGIARGRRGQLAPDPLGHEQGVAP